MGSVALTPMLLLSFKCVIPLQPDHQILCQPRVLLLPSALSQASFQILLPTPFSLGPSLTHP